MILKKGVDISRLHPRMVFALWEMEQVYIQFDRPEGVTITSGEDGKHGLSGGKSKHYPKDNASGMCEALDSRIRFFPWSIAEKVADEIQRRVGTDYDVLLKSEPPHIHVEYDPR